MRILIDTGHPADFLLFKNFAHEMRRKGHIVLFTIRDKDEWYRFSKVKDGFARNYLIPSNKAIRATKDNISYFEHQWTNSRFWRKKINRRACAENGQKVRARCSKVYKQSANPHL